MFGFIKRFLGDNKESEIRRMRGIVEKINALEPQMKQLSDGSLYGKTSDFKDRIANGESLDSILPEAFATCREAAKRVIESGAHSNMERAGDLFIKISS